MQACSILADNIACRRGDRVLFRGLSLDMRSGQALHISGANGIGKSSLMRILAGLLKPASGTVSHKGAIGLLDENPAIDPQARLADGLKFWAQIDNCGNPAGPELALDIGDLLDVPFRYLSTGQRKRAAFARLLNQNAAIWLLDEPLNGLDTDAQAKIGALIKLHCGGGGICIAASHQPIDLPEAQMIALEDFAV